MKISEIKIKNYKPYSGTVQFNFNNDIIYITGNNNVGKSTLFEAIDLLINGWPRLRESDNYKNKLSDQDDEVYIEITFSGDDIIKIVSEFCGDGTEKILKYIYKQNNIEYLRISKSSKERTWTNDCGEERTVSPNRACIYNSNKKQFEPLSSLMYSIKNMVNIIKIDADTSTDASVRNNNRIISRLAESFLSDQLYEELQETYSKYLNIIDNEILSKITEKLDAILQLQYNQYITTSFKFDDLNVRNLPLSKHDIEIDDGVKTSYKEKGDGLQRSLSLALIQVDANFSELKNKSIKKPTFYLIDEPETHLHPSGQHQLRDALETLSKNSAQVFVATHSIYVLDKFNNKNQDLLVLEKNNNTISNISDKLGLLYENPTPSELMYFAFNLPTLEFHNELFNYIQTMDNETGISVKRVDNYLYEYLNNHNNIDKNLLIESEFTKQNGDKIIYQTLPTKIRNAYHHRNGRELDISEDLLRECIELMRKYIKDHKNKR